LPPAAKITQEAPKPYSIVAATFSKKVNAEREVSRLRKEGFNSFVSPSGVFFRVYVGSFASGTDPDAQKELMRIKRIHRDAFISTR